MGAQILAPRGQKYLYLSGFINAHKHQNSAELAFQKAAHAERQPGGVFSLGNAKHDSILPTLHCLLLL